MHGWVGRRLESLGHSLVHCGLWLWVRAACAKSRHCARLRRHLDANGPHALHIRTTDLRLNRVILLTDQVIQCCAWDHVERLQATGMAVRILGVEFSGLSVLFGLIGSRGKSKQFMRYLRNGELKLNGNLNTLPWFGQLVKLMRSGASQ